MNSRSRSRRTSLGFSLGSAYSSGLSTSYGNGLGSGPYSSGYSSSYSSPSYSGYSSYLSRGAPSSSTALGYTSTGSGTTRYTSTSAYTSPVNTSGSYMKRYTGAKTDSELAAMATGVQSPSLSWRSKSIEASTNGYRDRSREPSVHEFSYRTRDKSLSRDAGRESSSAREYGRAQSSDADRHPVPPPRNKIQPVSNFKVPVYDSSTRFDNATQSLYNSRPMSRSNSFHDLRDATSPTTPKPRNRHQTLAFGVSEQDLQRAKSSVNLTRGSSSLDLRGASWRGSNHDLRAGSSGPFENGYSKSTLDLGYSSQPISRRESEANIPSSSTNPASSDKSKSKSQNGDIDYKKLWEESQAENTRLRMEMSSMRQDLDSTKHQLESAVQASQKNAVSDAEKREKKILEKKLSEMEEELKTLDQLKSDNQRLRDENGALIRVISKLSK